MNDEHDDHEHQDELVEKLRHLREQFGESQVDDAVKQLLINADVVWLNSLAFAMISLIAPDGPRSAHAFLRALDSTVMRYLAEGKAQDVHFDHLYLNRLRAALGVAVTQQAVYLDSCVGIAGERLN